MFDLTVDLFDLLLKKAPNREKVEIMTEPTEAK